MKKVILHKLMTISIALAALIVLPISGVFSAPQTNSSDSQINTNNSSYDNGFASRGLKINCLSIRNAGDASLGNIVQGIKRIYSYNCPTVVFEIHSKHETKSHVKITKIRDFQIPGFQTEVEWKTGSTPDCINDFSGAFAMQELNNQKKCYVMVRIKSITAVSVSAGTYYGFPEIQVEYN